MSVPCPMAQIPAATDAAPPPEEPPLGQEEQPPPEEKEAEPEKKAEAKHHGEFFEVHATATIDSDHRDPKPSCLEVAQWFEHRGVLGYLGDDVTTAGIERLGHTLQGEIVGLGGTGGQGDFGGKTSAERPSDGRSCFLEGREGIAARTVRAAGGVGE